MTDKIKRFIDCNFPVKTCNLRCHYCYVTQNREFEKELPKFQYSPEHIVKALSKKRLGGICNINICAEGETMLPPEIIPITKGLLKEGHYVNLITNGTISKRFDELAELPKELLSRLFLKFSFQFLELKRLNLLETYIRNVYKMNEAGASFSIEITPNDELIPYIEEIKTVSMEKFGALPHITVARDNRKEDLPILTKLTREEYKNIWSQFDSKMFEHKIEFFNVKRKEFCYAGVWSAFLMMGTGELRQCYKGKTINKNIYENLDEKIKFDMPVGCNCPDAHCFNSHAWLAFGDIPELKTPTYLEIRDRKTNNGMAWCKEPVKSFFETKLIESNKVFNKTIKKEGNIMKNFIKNIFSVYNEESRRIKRKVICILGIKIKLKTCKNTGLYSYINRKDLKRAIKLLQDNPSKKIFKARVKFLDSYDIITNKIPKSVYEEYLHPEVLIKKGDVVIDAGVSDWLDPTFRFAQLVGDCGKIIGFEPEPQCYQKAVCKISQSEYKNILVEPYGLWNKQTTLKISQEGRGSTVMHTHSVANMVDCKLLALDEYLKNNNIKKVDFIKMDIEGAEPEALEGAINTLKNITPNLAICVYHKPEHLFSIILYLNSLNLGYKFYLGHHRENEWSTILYAKK